ncbi:MAG: CHAT domain-containing protein [Cyanobacteria bacterium J06634_5]
MPEPPPRLESVFFAQYCLPLAAFSPFLGVGVSMQAVQAQSVVAAPDGTGTVVTEQAIGQGTQFTIEQGSLSTHGENLFHSFDAFSLATEDAANFVVSPSVENILTRVNGAEPSVIQGQLNISADSIAQGAQPNLFFMNPAGVLFGPDAVVNLPANLTVTTADAIAVGTEQQRGWFSAWENNDYAALSGSPTGEFIFSSSFPSSSSSFSIGDSSTSGSIVFGSIVNEGTLSVSPGSSLALIGGDVVNTGTLSAPGGDISMVAVPPNATHGSQVQLSRADSLLSLEISPVDMSFQDGPVGFSPVLLPSLLTYSPTIHATQLEMGADGESRLTTAVGAETDSGTGSAADAAVSSCWMKGCAIASGSLDVSSAHTFGGTISVVGEQVSVLAGDLSASGDLGGGLIRLGGDYRGQSALPSATQTIVNSKTTIAADAISTGDGGRVVVWADDATQYLGEISATGGAAGGDGGFVEISGKDSLVFRGSVDTRSPQGNIGSLLLDPENIVIVSGDQAPDNNQLADNRILRGDIGETYTISETALANLANHSALILEASNDIIVEPLVDGSLSFTAGFGPISFRADADRDGQGSFIMEDPNTALVAPGRPLFITGENLQLGDIDTSAAVRGGSVNLRASGWVTTGTIDTRADSEIGQGGNINIRAIETLATGDITTENSNEAGNVQLISQTRGITAGEIITTADSGDDGAIALSAPAPIVVNGEIFGEAPEPEVPEPEMPEPEVSEPEVPEPEVPELDVSEPEASLPGNGPSDDEPTDRLPTLKDNRILGAGVSSLSSGAVGGGAASESEGESASGYTLQRTTLSDAEANQAISSLETSQVQNFSTYFNQALAAEAVTLDEIRQMLSDIEQKSGDRSAVIYVKSPVAETDEGATTHPREIALGDSAQAKGALEIFVFTADGTPVKLAAPAVTLADLTETIRTFRADLLTSVRRGGTPYLSSAQQLHEWLLAPVEAEVGELSIDTLLFAMDTGLRTLPLAALHDGESFLVEKYSLGVVPSLGLLDAGYSSLADAQVLAMGASDFEQLAPLPAVPLEVAAIDELWPGSSHLNAQFTQKNLIEQRETLPYEIIHLATHAQFNAGDIDSSYVQLWDKKLSLGDLAQLGWQSPLVELLVLSACSTAVGSPEAEMGFAGLAVASGVRSAMASLWSVNDAGTLALMREFYQQLQRAPTKSEALRAAQLAMLQGNEGGVSPHPSELGTLGAVDFSHPYYWSGFTMIGNPW